MRLEGAGRRAAGVGDEHGRLDLHEAARVEEAADLADDQGALDKGIAHVGVDDQVHIALTIARVHVGQAVELLGQRLERLRQQRERIGVDRGLAGLGLKHGTGDANDVADVHLLEKGVLVRADAVARHIDLQQALAVLQLAEGGLAHDALDHHAPGDGDFLSLQLGKMREHLGAVVADFVLCDLEGVSPLLLQRGQLVPPYLQDLAQLLLGSGAQIRIVTHSFLSCKRTRAATRAARGNINKKAQLFSTDRISNLSSPAGASTTTVSPARWPIRPWPSGESSEMRPALGFASWLPTIS